MAIFYFDIETTGIDPETSKIVTIQYQELDQFTGAPVGDLVILREWELGEKAMVEFIMKKLVPWWFIPLGSNLKFDFKFIEKKANKYFGYVPPSFETMLHTLPHIDLFSTLVIRNNSVHKGSSLKTKPDLTGGMVPGWYENKEYDKIIYYVTYEAGVTIKFYQHLKELLKASRSIDYNNFTL